MDNLSSLIARVEGENPMKQRIQIGRKSYRKFLPYPSNVDDGTSRCIACGQIDEDGWHDSALCPGRGGKLPLSDKARAFMAANAKSPVVYGSAQPGGGGYYRLQDGSTFRLSLYDCRSTPQPKWLGVDEEVARDRISTGGE